MSAAIYFVSGIDTEIGKTYATGFLAKLWTAQGQRVITQKLVQTGNVDISEDIAKHREIMGCGWLPEDHAQLTMPQIFSYPASPHLATRLQGRALDLEKIHVATQQLAQQFDVVLLEGAGGLMVPLTDTLLTIDYIVQQQFPVILVTSGRLGSINHTLLSLEALQQRGVALHMVMYNLYHQSNDPIISKDTADYLKNYLAQHFPTAEWIELGEIQPK